MFEFDENKNLKNYFYDKQKKRIQKGGVKFKKKKQSFRKLYEK